MAKTNGVASLDPRFGRDAASIRTDFRDQLMCDLGVDSYVVSGTVNYLALAKAIRDRVMPQWIKSRQTQFKSKAKRVYYLSMEYLIGRSLGNNVINLQLEPEVRKAMQAEGLDLDKLYEDEADAGLGNGGLGRLAACFMDSLATLQIPAIGYGLRYEYGIFRQDIRNGYQMEQPDTWLRGGDPWEIVRANYRVPVEFGGRVETRNEDGKVYFDWVDTQTILGIPYDIPVVGYGGKTINTLRLWSAHSPQVFDFADFNQGDYIAAVESKVKAENITKVLYPNDNVYQGKELRLRQEYFFVACSVFDIVQRFRRMSDNWDELPNFAAIQLNDTHPSIAVAELMRLLMDMAGLSWERAWDITVKTTGFANHTLLPEALEKWPVDLFERLLPRHLQIIYEINHRMLAGVYARFPGDVRKAQRMSIIEEQPFRQVRMANLAIVGSHSINGVAQLHSDLVKSSLVPDFAQVFPERLNNKTNGVTPRRWLFRANPPLAGLISQRIGDGWITDLSQLKKLVPLAEDAGFRDQFLKVKNQAKHTLAGYLRGRFGYQVNPESLFDMQIKRIHEYKRQLLNALHIVIQYNRLRKNPQQGVVPRTYFFSGKAAPGYYLAKLIIKLINNIGLTIAADKGLSNRLAVYFVPNYSVTVAEHMIPAADISEQISTAGTEASGTGNMKFMMNGALTIGTMDGANIEIVEEVGKDNAFIFGLSTQQVADSRGWYSPWHHYNHDAETREALDTIFSDHFSPYERGIFEPLRGALLENGDRYMHLADLMSYTAAQDKVDATYRDRHGWARKAILNVACSGKFSSDRTILEYASNIWGVKPCPVEE